jgi:hypothetical protein
LLLLRISRSEGSDCSTVGMVMTLFSRPCVQQASPRSHQSSPTLPRFFATRNTTLCRNCGLLLASRSPCTTSQPPASHAKPSQACCIDTAKFRPSAAEVVGVKA